MARQTAQEITKSGTGEFPTSDPGHDKIEALAYQFWLDRGCPIGSAEVDWLRAEKELKTTTTQLERAA